MTSAYACPYNLSGGGGGGEGRESGVSPSGEGLCYIFFAGNRVMIDFKCNFYYHFFTSRNLFWSLKIDADWNGYVPILILYFFYIGVKAQEAGGI